jgi:hypothetical protein
MRGVSMDGRRRACGRPSRLAHEGEHLRMTAVLFGSRCVHKAGPRPAMMHGGQIEAPIAQTVEAFFWGD